MADVTPSGSSYDSYEDEEDEVEDLEEVPRELTWSETADVIQRDTRFQALMGLLIVANALVIGVETDYEGLQCWDYVENAFLLIFLGELWLKLFALGCSEYFSWENQDFNWNIFDFLIVGLGLLDVLMEVLNAGGTGGAATVFRIVRLLRILRIFRIVKFLKQLYVLAFGFALAAVAVFWVTVLMLFVLYICSILLVRLEGRIQDEEHAEFLHTRFSNIFLSMLTLFELMSSPNLSAYEGVMQDQPLFTAFLIGFIIFGSFGLVALLTGVISESMFQKNVLKQEEDRLQREAQRHMLIKSCEQLYTELPLNNDGEARRDDIPKVLPKVAKLFERLNVEFNQDDLIAMTDCLDVDGSGAVSSEEWRRCIIQMAEGVQPLQILEVHHKVSAIDKKAVVFDSTVEGLTTVWWKKEKEESAAARESLKRLTASVSSMTQSFQHLTDRVDKLAVKIEVEASPGLQGAG